MKKDKEKKGLETGVVASPLAEKRIEELLKAIRKKYGDDVVGMASDVKPPARIPTGITDLDAAVKGGWPRGRLTEIWGPQAAGKSSLICYSIGALQRSDPKARIAYFDLENTFDPVWAVRNGMDPSKVLHVKAMPIDDFEPLMLTMVRDNWDLIVIDSIVEVLPERELAKTSESGTVAVLAGTLTRLLPKIVVLQSRSKTAVLMTNQVRDKIGFFFGSSNRSPGGHALFHLDSLKLRVQRKERIVGSMLTDEMKKALGLKRAKSDKEYGFVIAARVVKSKVSREGEECRIPVLFDLGLWQGKGLPAPAQPAKPAAAPDGQAKPAVPAAGEESLDELLDTVNGDDEDDDE